MSEDEDYIIDDILKPRGSKRKNSGSKGKRGERGLRDILSERFKGQIFNRVVGSGNRWAQAVLSEQSKKVLTGDIVCPDSFVFCIECKHGYPQIDLCAVLAKDNAMINEFIDQASKDAERIGKKPLLCWKKDRQPWVAFLRREDLDQSKFTTAMIYGKWMAVSLELLLTLPDDFFFTHHQA